MNISYTRCSKCQMQLAGVMGKKLGVTYHEGTADGKIHSHGDEEWHAEIAYREVATE